MNKRLVLPSSAVHLITSESAAGSLRGGLAAPKTVIGFPDSFSIGPLWKLEDRKGEQYRKEWYADNINYGLEDYEYEGKFATTLREIEDIPSHVPIYIWYRDNADEQTVLRYYLYLVREKTNNLFLVNTTKVDEKYRGIVDENFLRHSSQLNAEHFKLFFQDHEKFMPLSDEMRNRYYAEWVRLSQSKEVLRLWINDEIIGTLENHYDQIIIETIELLQREQGINNFIQTGSVIIEVFSRLDEYVDLFFLEYRIRHLIYSGVLEMKGIPKSMSHYRVKLRQPKPHQN